MVEMFGPASRSPNKASASGTHASFRRSVKIQFHFELRISATGSKGAKSNRDYCSPSR